MKSVMISIQPKLCELIVSGEKTVDVRKSKPNIVTPFKCYIYQTKGKGMFNILRKIGLSDMANKLLLGKGKVIGEFVCNAIVSNCEMANADIAEQRGRIKREILLKYAGGKQLYGWNISQLVIYDRSKKINEFYHKKIKNGYTAEWNIEGVVHYPKKEIVFEEIKTPPQSWCYVEE